MHHVVLRRHVAAFGAPPTAWSELRPRGWAPGAGFGSVTLGENDTLRFLISLDGEPVAIPRGGGHFVGVDSSERYDRAHVVERPEMAWLRRLALDRPDVERALRKAAELELENVVTP